MQPTDPVSPAVSIRPEGPADGSAVWQVISAAFEGPAEADLVAALRQHPDCFSLVAVLAGEVVGHIFFSPVTFTNAPAPSRALGLGPVAVDPAQQGRGIGALLIRTGLEECRSRNVDLVVLLGHPSYYPRFGFVPAVEFGIQYSAPVPDEAFMVLELRPGALQDYHGIVHYLPKFDGV
jgi:putative acetyltransferase